MSYRTDDHNNPTAFTTDIAKNAGLIEGVDYVQGRSFLSGLNTYYTAKLLGDPIDITIRVIDALGFRTHAGNGRWTYINMPKFVWDSLTRELKVRTIGDMYQHEGGTAMKGLFLA